MKLRIGDVEEEVDLPRFRRTVQNAIVRDRRYALTWTRKDGSIVEVDFDNPELQRFREALWNAYPPPPLPPRPEGPPPMPGPRTPVRKYEAPAPPPGDDRFESADDLFAPPPAPGAAAPPPGWDDDPDLLT